MESAGRGPDQYAIVVSQLLEDVQVIQTAGVQIRQAYDRYERNQRKLMEERGTVWTQTWEPHVRAALAELKRREEPDVEDLLPEALKEVV